MRGSATAAPAQRYTAPLAPATAAPAARPRCCACGRAIVGLQPTLCRWQQAAAGSAHLQARQRRRRRRRWPMVAVAAGLLPQQQQQAPQRLWDYEGSRVVQATQTTVATLQRRAFGHRNPRTYVVVVADARSRACAAVEAPIETLASGLAHEPSVVVMALDAAPPAAAAFAARILNVGALPAVLVFPEGAPGLLAYKGADMTAEGLLRAVNAARLRALPGARPFELRHAVAPLQRLAPAAGPGGEALLLAPTPLEAPRPGSYWGPGKVALWAGLAAASLLALAWDRGLDERWEAWQLARRVRARREGKRSFTLAENMDDILSLLMLRGAADARAQAAAATDQQLGWRRMGVDEASVDEAAGSAAGQPPGWRPAAGSGSGGGGGRAASPTARDMRASGPAANAPPIDVESEAVAEQQQASSGSGGGSGGGGGATAGQQAEPQPQNSSSGPRPPVAR